mgnify:CR=1 FL=1
MQPPQIIAHVTGLMKPHLHTNDARPLGFGASWKYILWLNTIEFYEGFRDRHGSSFVEEGSICAVLRPISENIAGWGASRTADSVGNGRNLSNHVLGGLGEFIVVGTVIFGEHASTSKLQGLTATQPSMIKDFLAPVSEELTRDQGEQKMSLDKKTII